MPQPLPGHEGAVMGFLDRLFAKRSYATRFGEAHVLTMADASGRRVRVLELDGTFQSASYEGRAWNELPFEYFRQLDAIFAAEEAEVPIERVLMLGGGGFAWPKHALTTRRALRLDVVEIDSAILRIARKYFYLDRLERLLEEEGSEGGTDGSRLRIFLDDAYHHLLESEVTYDAIINDVFQAGLVPPTTSSDAFFSVVKSHLTRRGVYAQNVIVDLTREGGRRLYGLMEQMRATFRHVCAIDASDPEFGGADNFILLGSDESYGFDGCVEYDS